MGQILLDSIDGKTSTTITAQDTQTVRTLGSLSTCSFTFVNVKRNAIGRSLMIPFTKITVPETNQQFYITQANPTTLTNEIYQYSVSGIGIGRKLHWVYHTKQLINKTKGQDYKLSVEAIAEYIFKDSGCTYKIQSDLMGNELHAYKNGFGPGRGDTLLEKAAKDYDFEYYFKNDVCYLTKKMGVKDSFLFIEGINFTKASITKDFSKITTRIHGKGNPKKITQTLLKEVTKKAHTKHVKGKKVTVPAKTTTKKSTKHITKYELDKVYPSPMIKKLGWPIIDADPVTYSDNVSEKEFDKRLAEKLNDTPDVKITIDGVNFKKENQIKNINKNRLNLGDTGLIRDRNDVDITLRIRQITEYPQDIDKNDQFVVSNVPLQSTLAQRLLDGKKARQELKEARSEIDDDIHELTSALSSSLDQQEEYYSKFDDMEDKTKEDREKFSEFQSDYDTWRASIDAKK